MNPPYWYIGYIFYLHRKVVSCNRGILSPKQVSDLYAVRGPASLHLETVLSHLDRMEALVTNKISE